MIIGIDPGKSGGIAWNNYKSIAHCGMPDTVHDLVDLLKGMLNEDACEIHLEEVGGYTGGTGMPGSRAFVFGRGFGEILGAAAGLGIPVKLVKPQRWQKALGLGNSTGMTKTQWKNKLKARAQQLYPNSGKITLDVADAILIHHAAKEGLL